MSLKQGKRGYTILKQGAIVAGHPAIHYDTGPIIAALSCYGCLLPLCDYPQCTSKHSSMSTLWITTYLGSVGSTTAFPHQ